MINEAVVVADLLDQLAPRTILDCGSGSRVVRAIIQPHIAAVFDGYQVTWTDKDGSPGVLAVDWEKGVAGYESFFLQHDVVTCLACWSM